MALTFIGTFLFIGCVVLGFKGGIIAAMVLVGLSMLIDFGVMMLCLARGVVPKITTKTSVGMALNVSVMILACIYLACCGAA